MGHRLCRVSTVLCTSGIANLGFIWFILFETLSSRDAPLPPPRASARKRGAEKAMGPQAHVFRSGDTGCPPAEPPRRHRDPQATRFAWSATLSA
ncbi:MAG: hypothetical protein VB137_10285 [Burkholderia sp.]